MIYRLLSLWLTVLVLASCSKEDGRIDKIVEDDRIINFGATSDSSSPGLIVKSKDEIGTKTQYGIIVSEPGEDPYIQIEWKLTDIIRVSSPNSPGSTVADYQVSQLEPATNNKSVNVRPFDYSSYLIWGDESQQHSFYGVYPSPQTQTMSSNVSISNNITTTTLPSNQTSSSPKDMMKYAYMAGVGVNANMENPSLFGQNKIYPSDARKMGKNLIHFAPITTTFRIDFKNQIAAGTTITKVSLISQSKAMCGTYQTTLSDLNMTTMKVGMTHNTSAWTPSSTNKTIYASTDSDQSQYAPSETQSVTLFALPQNYNDLSVVFEASNGRTYTLALKKSGSYVNFDAYKYHVIQIGDVADPVIYHIDVVPSTITFEYTGGADQYTITSYVQNLITNAKSPVEWKTQVKVGSDWVDVSSLSDTNFPSWIDQFTLTDPSYNQTDATNGKAYDLNASASVLTFTPNAHTTALRSATPVATTKATARDLSMYDANGNLLSAQTTANCYVVRAPGWYKIPMVYGNAIDGLHGNSINTGAFRTTNVYSTFLQNLVDHLGNPITQPWVSNAHTGGAHTISKAELVWQNFQNLVTQISVGNGASSQDYIYFYVDPASIHQGNALIAAYDLNNKIAWSWHIWVTDTPITTQSLTNLDNVTYNVMNLFIGEEDERESSTASRRSVVMRMVQVVGGVEKAVSNEFEVVENSASIPSMRPTTTYYQSGRKDPMLPGNQPTYGSAYTIDNSIYYGPTGIATDGSWRVDELGIELKDMIQNPGVFNLTDSLDGRYSNLWDLHCGIPTRTNRIMGDECIMVFPNNIPQKTVYDPCPTGFVVPAYGTFTGFFPSKERIRYINTYNGYFDYSSRLCYFYTRPNDPTSPTISFWFAGSRLQNTGEFSGNNAICYVATVNVNMGEVYTSGTKNAATRWVYYDFLPDGISPYENTYRNHAVTVRPIVEDPTGYQANIGDQDYDEHNPD